MSKPADLNRCLAPLDQDHTIIAVIEMSQSSWLVAGIVPGIAFDAAGILLQPVVQVATGPVPRILAQRGADRPGIAVVAVGRDPVRRDAGHRLGGAEER